MSKSVISAQKQAIQELELAIETFIRGHNKTRVIPLAIPTGWGKTRIVLQGILRANYKTPPIIVIWPQKHSHISKDVWKRKTDWCIKKDACQDCIKTDEPIIKFIRTSKPGPKSGRHQKDFVSHNKKFNCTFYSVNNKFRTVIKELEQTKGPILFVIDEWHTKNLLSKYEEYKTINKRDNVKLSAETFWRNFLIGKQSTRKLFVILVSATPIGTTSDMDSISSDDTDDKFEESITDSLDLFSELTNVGNQKRKYNLYKIYPKVINLEERRLKNQQSICHYKCETERQEWIRDYISISKKAHANEIEMPRPPSLVYALESLLNSGVTVKIIQSYFKSLKRYFKKGFSKQKNTLKLLSLVNLLRKYSNKKFVIFCHYKAIAHNLDSFLHKMKIPSYYLEGNVRNNDTKFNDFNDEREK